MEFASEKQRKAVIELVKKLEAEGRSPVVLGPGEWNKLSESQRDFLIDFYKKEAKANGR